MDPKIVDLLNSLPDNPPRSKLEPHSEVISTLRKKRYTYRQISQFLHDHQKVDAAPSTIHDFIRVRRRQGKRTDAEFVQPRRDPKPVSTPETRPAETPDGLQQRIAALKHRSRNDSETKPRFVYDEAEPLQLRDPASNKRHDQEN
jgi:IS30 family transposase